MFVRSRGDKKYKKNMQENLKIVSRIIMQSIFQFLFKEMIRIVLVWEIVWKVWFDCLCLFDFARADRRVGCGTPPKNELSAKV